MPVKPMLGDLELEMVQEIESDQDRLLAQHAIPALEGDFLQELGRRATTITLTGVLAGEEVADQLKALREKFRGAEPVPFAADIATATRIDQVLIEEMGVRELAGRTQRFEYAFTLREYIPPPPPQEEPPPIDPPDPVDPVNGVLEVEVIVEGRPDFDFDTVTVTVRGKKDDGADLERTLTNRTSDNIWTENDFPPGNYTARAVVTNPQAMSGESSGVVRGGQTTRITIVLRPGQTTLIAKTFIVHFQFDRAFIEPCMRKVLEQVAEYATGHADEKMLVLGHTDLVGGDDYNQSLGERRARAVYTYLTYGRDPTATLADWDALRRTRPVGTLPSLNDTWGKREYQYILQDLGRYRGNIETEVPNSQDNDLTDEAVRKFQSDNGLTPDGIVGDDTWGALIRAYLDQKPLAVPEDRLLPNAKNSCDSGKLKWLSCGEKDPVIDTEDAWRPNRRTEILFIKTDALPTDVKQPETFNLPAPRAVNDSWCLNPSGTNTRTCFLNPYPQPANGGQRQHKETCSLPDDQEWTHEPAEPGDILVKGSIKFEDGTPLANTEYVLIAPDGFFMNGENPSGTLRGRPIPGRTDANGEFVYTTPSKIGIYTMEVRARVVARAEGQPLTDAKGNVVCQRLQEPQSTLNIIVTGLAAVSVTPTITLASPVVVVKKPYTNPLRQTATLGASPAFTGSGTFTRSSDAVRFFDAAVAGNEITFNGTDNVFTDAQLVAGVTLFAEGSRASAAVEDIELRLQLTVGGQPGFAATAKMTAVELTLDICQSRTAAGLDPAPLSVADKINPGRFLQAATPGNTHERAMLIVRQAQPAAFSGDLVLLPTNAQVRAFTQEVPAAGQAALPNPQIIPNATIPAAGLRFFAEGVTASNLARDTGFMLGLRNVENDADHIVATVIQLEVIAAPTAAAAALDFVRLGLWDNAFDAVTGNLLNDTADARNFISLDNRRFYFRVRNPAAAAEVTVNWRTVFEDGSNDDAPANQSLSLLETAAGSGVFISKAVMLVADTTDRDERVNSGLPAAHADAGDRLRGQSNHRKRMITVSDAHQLDNRMRIEFTPTAGTGPFNVNLPVFQRTPEERRRIRVHLVNVRNRVGGAGALTAARRNLVKSTFQSIYAVCGIFAEVDEILLDPPASNTGWPTNYPTDPIAIDPAVEGFSMPAAVLVPSASQTDVINAVRALANFSANDVYVICVARIYSAPVPAPPGPGLVSGGGEAFPDSWVPAASITRSFCFVGTASGITELADVHEVTHITTNLNNAAGGHFDLGAPAAAAVGPIDGKNLMNRFFLTTANSVRNPKRLWDTQFNNALYAPALVLPRQIDTIRNSRYIRPF